MNRRSVAALPLIIPALVMVALAMSAAVAASFTYSFQLTGPQITADPNTGATIRTTGSGSFSQSPPAVVASGSFAEFDASGSETARGTWVATSFGNFTPFGGPVAGFQGGVLHITVTLVEDSGATRAGVPMTVNCLVDAPAGFTGSEGDSIGDFTVQLRGRTLFHLNQ
jgi:hypothetical protein